MPFEPYTFYVLASFGFAFVLLMLCVVVLMRQRRELDRTLQTLKGESMSQDDMPQNDRSISPKRRVFMLALVPLVLFGALFALFYSRLDEGNPNQVPSALIGKALPSFDLKPIEGLANIPGIASQNLTQGQVTVLNVFASWCGPCRDEHPFVVELSKNPKLRVVGLNYKDTPDNARKFLSQHGNPYVAVGSDRTGRVAMDFGVYGVPETFIISAEGRIVTRLVGPLNAKRIAEEINPVLVKLGVL